jgi:hypothetical protein
VHLVARVKRPRPIAQYAQVEPFLCLRGGIAETVQIGVPRYLPTSHRLGNQAGQVIRQPVRDPFIAVNRQTPGLGTLLQCKLLLPAVAAPLFMVQLDRVALGGEAVQDFKGPVGGATVNNDNLGAHVQTADAVFDETLFVLTDDKGRDGQLHSSSPANTFM